MAEEQKTISMIKSGDILTHPTHGDMTVIMVEPAEYEEFIPAIKELAKGYRVTAIFDKFIPGVKWAHITGANKKVSKLIFHSYYLKNLQLKGAKS